MRLANGTSTAVWHLAVSAAILGEDLLVFAERAGVGTLGALPLLQVQNVAVAMGLGLIAGLAWERRPARAAALLLATALTLLVVLDQIVVKLFLSHARFSLAEAEVTDLRRLLGSALAEAGQLTAVNLVLAAALGVLLHLRRVHARITEAADALFRKLRAPVPALAAVALVVAWAVVSLRWGPPRDPLRLRDHPLLSLASSAGSARRGPPAECAEQPQGPALLDGAPSAPDFAAVRARLHASGARPNVLLIVLESVGALQLLEDGLPSATLAPRLRALAARGVTFSAVYSNYPATTRTHVPLLAGGRTLTWGGVDEDLKHVYLGPTLPRELQKAGYRMALLSAQGLKFGALGDFYKQQPFDLVVDPDAPPDPSLAIADSSQWGISEEALLEPALRWLREHPEKPFFLELLTNSTHHPYVAPGLPEGSDAPHRYREAIRATDAALGRLFDRLHEEGLDKNTLVAVIGDHGEGFGDLHPGNLIHKSFLYEENVRSFLLLSHPALEAGVASPQLASVGDVAPTLLSLCGLAADMPGQDLLSERYSTRSQFLYTFSDPQLWGVRDGRWKYVAQQGGDRAQLYDLVTDPGETRNLAAASPERLADAECRCRRWYLHTEEEFRARLENAPEAAKKLTLQDLAKAPPGPRKLSLRLQTGKELPARVHPWEALTAHVDWDPDSDERNGSLRVLPPAGAPVVTDLELEAKTAQTDTPLWASLPLAEGRWQVELAGENGGPTLLSAEFEVAAAAEPSVPLEGLRPQEFVLEPGYDTPGVPDEGAGSDEPDPVFHAARQLPANAKLVISANWKSPQAALRVTFLLQRGDEVRREEAVLEQPGGLYVLGLEAPLAPGAWTFTATTSDGAALGETAFEQLGPAPAARARTRGDRAGKPVLPRTPPP